MNKYEICMYSYRCKISQNVLKVIQLYSQLVLSMATLLMSNSGQVLAMNEPTKYEHSWLKKQLFWNTLYISAVWSEGGFELRGAGKFVFIISQEIVYGHETGCYRRIKDGIKWEIELESEEDIEMLDHAASVTGLTHGMCAF